LKIGNRFIFDNEINVTNSNSRHVFSEFTL
jgi:hypothetical protein